MCDFIFSNFASSFQKQFWEKKHVGSELLIVLIFFPKGFYFLNMSWI